MRMYYVFFIVVSFLSSQAWSQAAAPAANPQASPLQGVLMNLPLLLLLFAFFYFAVINPQRKQQKQQQEFLSNLKQGDEVITSSGIIGTIQGLTDKVATLEVSPDVEVKMLRSQIQASLKTAIDSTPAKK